MKLKVLFVFVLFVVFSISLPSNGLAAIYKYTDKDDMIHFVDDLQSVPEQYRSSAKIVSGEEKEEIKTQSSQPPAQVETKKTEISTSSIAEKVEAAPFGKRAIISAIIIVSALFAFIILKRLDMDNKKVITITRIVILWGISIFLLYAHAGDVVSAFSSIGNKIENTQQKAEEKGKKAAKAIKAMDALAERAENQSANDMQSTESENSKQ